MFWLGRASRDIPTSGWCWAVEEGQEGHDITWGLTDTWLACVTRDHGSVGHVPDVTLTSRGRDQAITHSSSRLTDAIVRGNQNWVSEIEFYTHTISLLQRKPSFISSRSNDVGKSDIDQVWVTSSTNIPLWSICPSLSSHYLVTSHTQTKEGERSQEYSPSPWPSPTQSPSIISIVKNVRLIKFYSL